MRFTILLFLFLAPNLCFGQNYLFDNLKNNKWTSNLTVTDFNFHDNKEIGLTKLNASINELKSDFSVWEFGENYLKVTNYKGGQKLDSLILDCTYDSNKNELHFFHFSQDSTFWNYSLAITSTGSFILMTRENCLH